MQNSENKRETIEQANTAHQPEKKSERSSSDAITECKRQEKLNIILRDLAVKLSAITELDEGLRLCLEAAIEISGMDCGGVYLVDEASGGLDMAFHKGLSPDFVEFVLRYEADSDSVRLVMRGKPVYKQHQRLGVPLDEKKKREGLRAIAVIPMLHKGRIVGCLNIASHTLWEVPAWSRMVLETIAAQISGTVVRLRAEQALCESEHKFKAIFDAANDGIVLAEPETKKFSTGNKMFCRMLGYSLKEIQDMGVSDIHPEEALPQVIEQFEKQSKNEFTLASNIPVKRKDGSVFYTDVNSSLITLEGKTLLMGIFRDITERKKAEEALRESEQKLRSIIDHSVEVFYIHDTEHELTYVSPQSEAIFGYTPEEMMVKWTSLTTDNPVNEEGFKLTEKAIKTGEKQDPYLLELRRKNGQLRIIEVDESPVKNEKEQVTAITGAARDVTERKKAKEKLLDYQVQLKSLASQLSLIEERERRRIAIELHDQIGQSLVFSKLKLDELHQSATSSELTKALGEICNNIGQIIQDTRTLTFDLSSPILNEIGLEAAVAEWLDVQIRAKYGIETEFEDDGQQKPLDDDIRALLFRNVRELLVNVIKHAHANKVKVSIRRVNEHIRIDVEDDGKGFDAVKITSTAAKEAKFGLFSIRERLEHLGGSFETKSEPDRGSKITMTAPLKRA